MPVRIGDEERHMCEYILYLVSGDTVLGTMSNIARVPLKTIILNYHCQCIAKCKTLVKQFVFDFISSLSARGSFSEHPHLPIWLPEIIDAGLFQTGGTIVIAMRGGLIVLKKQRPTFKSDTPVAQLMPKTSTPSASRWLILALILTAFIPTTD